MVTINFARVKEKAIIPTKRREDAGYDIYACLDNDFLTICPHETKMIPTGIASAVDSDYWLCVKERGSTGAKGMGVRAGVIDSGYRNEILIMITNENNVPLVIANEEEVKERNLPSNVIIYPIYKAIAQLILLPNIQAEVKTFPYEELKQISSERQLGKLGSTDK